MFSMTGFSSLNYSSSFGDFTLDIKSYNTRYLDIFVYLPNDFRFLEESIRSEIAKNIKRGKVEFSLHYKKNLTKQTLNKEAINEFKNLANLVKKNGIKIDYRLADLEKFGLFSSLNNKEFRLTFANILQDVIKDFVAFRAKEGQSLKKDLQKQADILKNSLVLLKDLAVESDSKTKQVLQAKFSEVVGSDLSTTRIMEEIAVYLAKTNINEELVRLESHISLLNSYLLSSECTGKKLDFLAQELNREINTIGSKTTLLSIQNEVLKLKEVIENIREQSRNVE